MNTVINKNRVRLSWMFGMAAGYGVLLAGPACGQSPDAPLEADVDQPEDGAWAPCGPNGECDGALYCVGESEPGFCSVSCVRGPDLYPDPQWCFDPPGGLDIEVGCVYPFPAPADGFIRFCGLLCSDTSPCPRGMSCFFDREDDVRYCE